MTLPSLTLSPTLTFNSLTVPADGAGTSIVALSDSSVTSGSSGFTASPGLTKTSMTGTSLKSPMSGTLTGTSPPGPAAAEGFGGGAAGSLVVACAAAGAASVPAGRGALAAGAAFPLPSADSSVRIALPSLTLSPTLTLRSLTVPALGAGTSMVALSDSSVTSESSAFTASPGLTKTSMTGTSLKSPMSGTLTSIVLMETSEAHPRRRKAARDGRADFSHGALRPWRLCGGSVVVMRQTVHGAGFDASMPYFFIASATFAVGRAPSSASALSAATVT